jgi:anhydro-N-acetylmuramic acid kinase
MSTLQIGEPAVIAERTGRPVVADFRVRDMAAGGQGAPLVPYVDNLLFAHPVAGRVLTNIGGIANITILPAGADSSKSTAFDTGPGNMVIDAIVQFGTDNQERYDKDGQYARQGKIDTVWLDELMADDYFAMKPPKSTGREKYTKQFAAELWQEGKRRGLSFHDIVATVTEWTACSIAQSLHDFVLPTTAVAEMIVSGGGSYNPVLMSSLAKRLTGVKVAQIDDYGMPSDAKEAIAFAILGNECVHGVFSNVPTATGAGKPVVLGKLIQA